MMTTSLMTITPELAKSILDSSNNNNRSISTDRVDTYARAMSAGQWMLTHQGISFYDDGELADGQHRLMAVVKSGSTIQMLCTNGLSRMCLIGIDSGRPRDATGVIQIAGGGDDVTSRHVGIIRKAVRSGLVRGMTPTSHLSPAEIYGVFKANKEKIDFGAKSMKKKCSNFFLSANLPPASPSIILLWGGGVVIWEGGLVILYKYHTLLYVNNIFNECI